SAGAKGGAFGATSECCMSSHAFVPGPAIRGRRIISGAGGLAIRSRFRCVDGEGPGPADCTRGVALRPPTPMMVPRGGVLVDRLIASLAPDGETSRALDAA